MSYQRFVLVLLHFANVRALQNISTIPQHCYQGSGLEPLVFVGRFQSGSKGTDDVYNHYNVLNPAKEIVEIPCSIIRRKYTLVQYTYSLKLIESWLAAIDIQPWSICLDNSYEPGFKNMDGKISASFDAFRLIHTGMDHSKTDSSPHALFRSYDLCMTYALTKFKFAHAMAISQEEHEEKVNGVETQKDYRFVLLINKPKEWRIWFLARLYEYGILSSTLYTLPERPHACSYHVKSHKVRHEECMEMPNPSDAAIQFASDVDPRILDGSDIVAGQPVLSEFHLKAMIPRGRVHIILESEPTSLMDNHNVCMWTERVTEKTWNAISFGHAFVLVGTFLSLDLVRAHGFKTFSPCINETYGTISNEDLKLQAALDEVRRLQALSDVEYNHLYTTCLRPRAQFNYDLFHSEEYKRKQVQQRLWAWGIADTPGFDLGDFRAKCEDVVLKRNNASLSKCRR